MNIILNRDILRFISGFLDNNDLFFYVQTCRDFSECLEKNVYSNIVIPSNKFIFSNVKYMLWLDDFKDFKVKDRDMYVLGINYGDCNVLDYIKHKIGNEYLCFDLYKQSAFKSSILKLNWLKKNKCPYDVHLRYDNMVFFNAEPAFKWIIDELIYDEDKFYEFLKKNDDDFESIGWILKSIPELSEEFCELAVSLNNMKLLNWGIENNCPLSVHCCSRAASIGNLEMLKFLKYKNCPWNCWTTTEAASNGYMYVLEWSYNNGCPLETYGLVDAMQNDHSDIIRWLIQHNCPVDETVLHIADIKNYKHEY